MRHHAVSLISSLNEERSFSSGSYFLKTKTNHSVPSGAGSPRAVNTFRRVSKPHLLHQTGEFATRGGRRAEAFNSRRALPKCPLVVTLDALA